MLSEGFNNRFQLVNCCKFFFHTFFCASLLFSCDKVGEVTVNEHRSMCLKYGYTPDSVQFDKCLKRQNIIANYESKHWLMLTLGLK